MKCNRLLLIFCVLGSILANAQEFSNKGKEFWLAYPAHIDGTGSAMGIYITSDVDANGTISIGSSTISFTVTANSVTRKFIGPNATGDLPNTNAYLSSQNGVTIGAGIKIVSDKPVAVYAHIVRTSRSGATLVIPTNVWGKEYIVPSYRNQSINVTDINRGYGEIAIMAKEPNTVVEITPSIPVRSGSSASYTITLANPGDVYQVQFQQNADISGTRVKSISSNGNGCQPIAVFSATTWSAFGCSATNANNSSGDNLFQQLFPLSSWGKSFITAPLFSRPSDIIRVYVSNSSTIISKTESGTISQLTGLQPGNYYEFSTSNPIKLDADQPISVVQFMTTQSCGTSSADPEMILLNPVEQTINNITVFSAHRNFVPVNQSAIVNCYLNIIIKTNAANSFKINGAKPTGVFIPISSTDFSYLQENVSVISASNPVQTLTADSSFSAIAYGTGNVESYGYNAGTNVIDLNPPVSIQNDFSATNVSYSATCTNSPFKVNLSLSYQPEDIKLDLTGVSNLNGPPQFTYTPKVSPSTPNKYDSTYISNGKQYYVYRVPQSYSFIAVGKYPIKITTRTTLPQSDGCSNTNEQEITDNIVVNAPPTADFSISTNNCFTAPVTLTDLSDGVGRSIVRWLWEFSDATTSSSQNPSKTFTASGNYTAKLTSVTDFGCIATVTKNISLSAKPVAAFTVPALRCENSSVSFTDASTIVAGSTNNTITRWNWNLDNGGGFVDVNSNATQSTTYTVWGNKDVRLTVVSNTGCISDTFRLSPQFKINPLPQVGFTVPEVCLSAANAVFTDTSKIADGSESGFLYSWKFNNGAVPIVKGPTPAISSLKNPSALYKDTGNYIVTLQVTSNNGCIASLNSGFIVNGSNPVPSFTVVTNTLCSNDSVKIINTSTVDFGTVTKLEIYWDSILNPSVKYVDDNPTPNKIYATQYAKFFSPASKNVGIKIVAFSGNSSACARSTNQNKTVNGSANITFVKPRDVCNEASPRLITQGSFASAVASNTAEYSGTGINSSGLYSPQLVVPGTYAIKYKVTNAAGCKDSASQPITVWPTPVAKWGVQTILCEKNTIAFTDSSVANFSNIAQRKWDYGDGFNETRTSITSFNRIYNTAQTYNASLQVITDSGCVSTINQQSIRVNPLPIPAFTLPTVVCLPDGRATFTNQSTIADGSESLFSYYWNFGNPSDPTPSLLKEPTHKYSALGPVNVQLRVTSKDQCVDSLTKSFNNIYPWPKANMGINVVTACVGDTVYFTDNGNGISSSATSWRWDLAQGFSSQLKNPSRQFSDSGTYTIKYYFFNAQGCVSDTVSKDLTVYPYPKLTLPKRVNVLEGGNLMIKPIYKYGTNLSYMWTPSTYLNNPTDSTPITTPLGDITYRLFLTGIGGCTVNDTIFVKLLLSPLVPNAFSPNGDGINDRWRIQYLESYPGATVDVFNRYGQTVFSSVGYSVDWDGTVNGNPLPIGTYYYVINPKNGRKTISGSVTIIR
jgi:gliding motility-associated-like protein